MFVLLYIKLGKDGTTTNITISGNIMMAEVRQSAAPNQYRGFFASLSLLMTLMN